MKQIKKQWPKWPLIIDAKGAIRGGASPWVDGDNPPDEPGGEG